MLSFGNDSSLFCDFQESMFKLLSYNPLNMILVRHFHPRTGASPGPARWRFCINTSTTKAPRSSGPARLGREEGATRLRPALSRRSEAKTDERGAKPRFIFGA
jgi:hypothetical protein